MHDRFLRACRREPTDVTPVWFMRQACRYMAEYRALRQMHTLLEICRTPELALEVTLQPLRLGMDAAILFADILLPLEPMGAPFTIASYLVEGGKSSDYRLTKQIMWSDPEAWSALMGKISEVVRRLLRAQVAAGAQAVQLFDSWVGALSIDDYREHVQPHVRYILRDLESTGVPVIHFGTGNPLLLRQLVLAGDAAGAADADDSRGHGVGFRRRQGERF